MLKSPFTASAVQVACYLFGVALFSISFLVFVNSSVSFVITDLIGAGKKGLGDAVGTLGFADELVALVACPAWGILSDRLGVRTVCVLGYGIIGISLFVFVQAKDVYPGLLLARMFFSLGGAAASTMVTAILPTMTTEKVEQSNGAVSYAHTRTNHAHSHSVSSEITVTPSSYLPRSSSEPSVSGRRSPKTANSQIAGFVGMFTGLGALIALFGFLPLPAKFQKNGDSPAQAVANSFYVVGAVSLAVAILVGIGLRNLPGERDKGFVKLCVGFNRPRKQGSGTRAKVWSYWRLLLESIKLGFTDVAIGLGYLGGFVARASSVGISLFIPLYVNGYFREIGRCHGNPNVPPGLIKDDCRRAYTVAAMLSGVSQLFALIFAPIFGYLDGRFQRYNLPIIIAAVAGIIGYTVLPQLQSPDPTSEDGSAGIFVVVALLGISQIGAIVCSLSILGRGIQGSVHAIHAEIPSPPPAYSERDYEGNEGGEQEEEARESSHLLPSHLQRLGSTASSRGHLKGSIAGVYSLAGGAGILLLTRLGGALFDSTSFGSPFYMLAVFNAILLVVGCACTVGGEINKSRHRLAL